MKPPSSEGKCLSPHRQEDQNSFFPLQEHVTCDLRNAGHSIVHILAFTSSLLIRCSFGNYFYCQVEATGN
jgi:hypothetical protein